MDGDIFGNDPRVDADIFFIWIKRWVSKTIRIHVDEAKQA